MLPFEPKPGSGFSMGGTTSIQYIEPDFIIVNRDGTLELSLNSRNSPELKLS